MWVIKYATLAFAIAGLVFAAAPVNAVTITIACDPSAAGHICGDSAQAWAKKTGNIVKVVPVPPNSEQLGIYQQFLAAESSVVDIYTIDIVWPGVLSNYLVDMSAQAASTIGEHFPAIVKNNTINGKLIAMPWYTDAGMLYYRKDLLLKYGEKVPGTWEDLAAIAKRIQDAERKAGNNKMWGYVWQGKSSEALSCDAIEWLASYNGGSVVDASGKITVNNPGAIKALQEAKSWIGTISPPEVLGFDEEMGRAVFQGGNAVFMRNWPYAWGLANSEGSVIKGKVGVAALPKGGQDGRGAATLGGQQLAVSKYSRHIDAAIDLVMYLTSKEEQRHRAIEGGFNPTFPSLYKDKAVIAANPFQGELYDVFVNSTARPSTATRGKYTQVSSEFWNTVHDVLAGKQDAAGAVRDLDAKLHTINRDGKW